MEEQVIKSRTRKLTARGLATRKLILSTTVELIAKTRIPRVQYPIDFRGMWNTAWFDPPSVSDTTGFDGVGH
ncbi:hypothetical protein ACFSTD_23825 [Novosphingobium colocasiae]